MRRWIASLTVIVVISALLITPAAGAAAPTSDPANVDEPTLHVDLAADGDATVSLVSTYDRSDEDERDAFETLAEDDEAQAEMLDRFADRTQSVAENANEAIDREMTVTADSVDVRTDDDRGLVVLSVSWERLAAVEDDRLVLTEPFESGFEPDRTLVVVGPEGATIEATTPAPDDESDGLASWDTGTDLDGFEAAFTLSGAETTGDEADADEDSLPGFGSAVTLVALLAIVSATAIRTK